MDETPKPPPWEIPEGSPQTPLGTENVKSNSEGGASPSAFSNGGSGQPSASEKQWAVGIHLSALTGFMIPFFNILAPLVLWLFKRPESAWLDKEGKQVLNFQISFTIYALIASLSLLILIGLLVLPILVLVYLIFLIIGAIRASEGIPYHFPLTIKFFK